MSKVAIVGSREAVLCYLSVGFSVYFAEDGESAASGLDRAEKDGAEIIFVSPEYADALSDKIASYAGRFSPAVSVLPGTAEGSGGATLVMRRAVERAVGANIVYKE